MDRFDDDTLLAELRELRPTPRPEFAAELDQRAAAGFPRRDSRAGTKRFARLRGISLRGRLVPVIGFAIVVLTVATVVVAVSTSGGGHASSIAGSLHVEHGVSSSGAVEEGASAGAESAEAGGNRGGTPEFEAESTESFAVPNAKSSGKSAETAKPEEETEGTLHAGEAAGGAEMELEEESSVEAEPRAEFAPATNGQVKTRGHREVERSSSIVLGTKPDQVAGAAAKVYAAVHAANGIVLNSSVESGSAGATGASFSLLIPSGKVDDALAAFSRIAEVRSRHDATQDITKPTVGVTEELRDSNASIEGLLKELGSAETEAERESVEARLREERRRHASIRASLEHLHKRASMSEVSLRIVTSHGAGAVPVGKGKSGGDWSVADALHDAANILTIVAGVALIGLAILAPFALIGLLAWLANRFRVRRLRERALG
jgi:hypothetical protein